MVKPSFEMTDTMVPILSKEQIENIAIDILKDFNPDLLENPQPLDIDRFLERYLGASIDYKTLSSSHTYLGMTIFADCCKVPVYNREARRAEYISCKAGTVLLDTSLLNDNQQHRYLFTAAHEAAHMILHGDYFRYRLEIAHNQPAYMRCQQDFRRTGRTCRTDGEWIEWQADHLASALLMPLPAVQLAVARARYRSASVNYAQEAIQIVFNVSCAAAGQRHAQLEQAGLLDPYMPSDDDDLPF